MHAAGRGRRAVAPGGPVHVAFDVLAQAAQGRRAERNWAVRGGASRPTDREIAELRRRAERAEAELLQAKKVIEIQGNVSALVEQMLGTEGESGSTER